MKKESAPTVLFQPAVFLNMAASLSYDAMVDLLKRCPGEDEKKAAAAIVACIAALLAGEEKIDCENADAFHSQVYDMAGRLDLIDVLSKVNRAIAG